MDDISSAERKDVPPAKKWYAMDFNDNSWEEITVPEYRYQKVGQHLGASFVAWYRTTFSAPVIKQGKSVHLVFQGVDWRAQVWLNGRFLGSHVAYYEPFRFDVTDILKENNNVLAVRVIEGPMFGEPVSWWGPLPVPESSNPRYTRDNQAEFMRNLTGRDMGHSLFTGGGGGIFREVYLEHRGDTFVNAVFARANLQDNTVKVKVELDAVKGRDVSISTQIIPENFNGQSFQKAVNKKLPEGSTTCEILIPVRDARTWSPQSPYLYRCRVVLRDASGVIDAKDILFGYRSFSVASLEDSQDSGEIPGTLYLNNKPIFLRGAGIEGEDMWWYWGQDEKLINCLLMLKIANFNMVRACEYTCFPEVREYMDRLGIMSQQDQGYGLHIGLTPWDELIATARPLTRVCYNNPGVILLSFANEIFLDPNLAKQIADDVIKVDPERVIVFSGCPYTQPEGYSKNLVHDIHSYEGWYPWGSVMPGKLWQMTKKYTRNNTAGLKGNSRMTVGEYGGEGLDAYETMKSFYPPQFNIPDSPDLDVLKGNSHQTLKADVRQQVGFNGMQPGNLGEYIEASQSYQASIVVELTTAFRLSPERISGYMVFSFAEALPNHWAKSIVSSDLRPKKAYYEMAKLNQPLVPLFQIQEDGNFMEVWVANDFPLEFKDCRVSWKIESEGKILLADARTSDILASDATLIETVDLTTMPEDTRMIEVSLIAEDAKGKKLSSYKRELWLELWRKKELALPEWASQQAERAKLERLARLRGVTITASHYQQGHGPYKTIDDSLSTCWSVQSAPNVVPWIKYEFEKREVIDAVSIAFLLGAERRYSFGIEVSNDDKDWLEVINGKSSGATSGLERFEFNEVKAKYVRIKGYSNNVNEWNNYSEVVINRN